MTTADWQPDPTGRHDTRRRNPDGTWTDQVADYGVISRDTYDRTQPEPILVKQEPEPEQPAEINDEPSVATPKPFWTRTKITIAIILVMTGLFVAACGPETLCIAQGGDPVQNMFGVEWCELDGKIGPSDGDFLLDW